jgi:hypothetical protein
MADEKSDKTGIRVDGRRVDVSLSQKTTDQIVTAVSPHLKWLVFAAALGLAVISICFGVSLLWTA